MIDWCIFQPCVNIAFISHYVKLDIEKRFSEVSDSVRDLSILSAHFTMLPVPVWSPKHRENNSVFQDLGMDAIRKYCSHFNTLMLVMKVFREDIHSRVRVWLIEKAMDRILWSATINRWNCTDINSEEVICHFLALCHLLNTPGNVHPLD